MDEDTPIDLGITAEDMATRQQFIREQLLSTTGTKLPYYSLAWAEKMIKVVEVWKKNELRPFIWRPELRNMDRQSVKTMVQNIKRYMKDYLPNHECTAILASTRMVARGDAWEMQYHGGDATGNFDLMEMVDFAPAQSSTDLRVEFNEWLKDVNAEPFRRENLTLTGEDLAYWNELRAALVQPNEDGIQVMMRVTKDRILAMRAKVEEEPVV